MIPTRCTDIRYTAWTRQKITVHSRILPCALRALVALVVLGAGFVPLAVSAQESYVYQNAVGDSASQDAGQRYRLRIVWGGGASTIWKGTLQLSEGRFENVVPLGLEPDAGASLLVDGSQLQINPVRKADFAGLDIDVVNDAGHEIVLSMISPELGVGIQHKVIDLSPLLQPGLPTEGIQLQLDDSGNRLDINRAPGDRLPLVINRPHLVFDPGELFEFSVRPFRGTPEAGDKARLHLELFRAGEERAEFDEQLDLSWDGTWYSLPEEIQLALPQQEGAYDIRLTLRDGSLATRLNLGGKRISCTAQVVVVDRDSTKPELPAQQMVLWNEVYHSEAVRNQWIDKLPSVPQFRMASSGENEAPRDQGVAPEMIDGKTWNGFAPGGWQAVPIEVAELNQPHIVEIEYLDDGPMALGISVIQPDDAGQVDSFGVDSGIVVPEQRTRGKPEIRRHRIFFWPQHEKPYVLFANRHSQRKARIGAIRVLAGPDRLAAADVYDRPADVADSTIRRRQYMSFYEKPLFAENFSARKTFDPETGQSWHDWDSFLTGAIRWTQYLKANGYSSAMLVVAGDGSSLYPSALLQPTPKYDSGAYSTRSRDPLRKDVVELLLRVFHREGLDLVPVFHFNAPLVELERLRLSESGAAEGITIVDLQGSNRLAALRDSATSVSIYNPLDARVQSAHLAVVREFMNRYPDHQDCLDGIGFLYSGNAVQVLPGQTWGADPLTLQRFAAESGINTSESPDWFLNSLNSGGRIAWLDWRQGRMASWLDDIRSAIGADRRMYLMGSDLLETQDAFSALAPSLRRLSDMKDALHRIGLPVDRIAEDSGITFLHPYEQAPEKSLADSRLNIHLNETVDGMNFFDKFASGGVLISHKSTWAEFDQLGKQNLFGQVQRQPLMRLQPLSTAGAWSRRHLAQSIADHDSLTLVDGGWLTRFGQEEHTSGLIEIFTRLPDIRFQQVAGTEETSARTGVVVRQQVAGGRNWFYVVNSSPWPAQCRVRFSDSSTIVESLGATLSFENLGDPEVLIELEPFSIQAGHVDAAVMVTGIQVKLPEGIASELQDRLNDLLPKVSRAANAKPVDVLANPGFEPVEQGDSGAPSFGWTFDNRIQNAITLNQEQKVEGQSSIRMTSEGSPIWVRSNQIASPETGRLSVSVMIRTDDPEVQPPLRISIQGDDGRQVYYRYGTVGGPSRQITSEWQQFAVHFDDLPLGEHKSDLKIGFDLMGAGQVDLDQVRVYDRWLDVQDTRALTHLLASAGYQLTNNQNVDRCRRMLEGYWPRFLDEFFPAADAIPATVGEEDQNRPSRSTQAQQNSGESSAEKR